MKNNIKFSGIGSGFNPHDGNTSAFVQEKKRLLMIDSGEQTFSAMLRNGVLENSIDVSLLLTHLHSDHAGSLGNLAMYSKFVKNNPLKIYVSENQKQIEHIEKLLEIHGIAPDWIKILSEKDLDGMFKSFNTARYIQTNHTKNQLAFGIDFTTDKGDVYYTGDTKEVTQVESKLDSGRKIHQIYADMTAIENPSPKLTVHSSVKDYEKLITPAKRHLITGMHFNNQSVKDYAKSIGFNVAEKYQK